MTAVATTPIPPSTVVHERLEACLAEAQLLRKQYVLSLRWEQKAAKAVSPASPPPPRRPAAPAAAPSAS